MSIEELIDKITDELIVLYDMKGAILTSMLKSGYTGYVNLDVLNTKIQTLEHVISLIRDSENS